MIEVEGICQRLNKLALVGLKADRLRREECKLTSSSSSKRVKPPYNGSVDVELKVPPEDSASAIGCVAAELAMSIRIWTGQTYAE